MAALVHPSAMGRSGGIRLGGTLAIVCLLALGAVSAAGAKAPAPDAHDRALARTLDAKVSTFRAIAAKKNDNTSLDKTLKNCPTFKKDPAKAFAAVFALLPALLADLVNQFRPEITGVRDTLAAVHPDSPLFRQWVVAQKQNFGLILRFDNHGKKINYCRAATVMLSKKSTAADVRDAIGIDPALFATLFSSGSGKASARLKSLNARMRPFLRAAGISAANVTALTR